MLMLIILRAVSMAAVRDIQQLAFATLNVMIVSIAASTCQTYAMKVLSILGI